MKLGRPAVYDERRRYFLQRIVRFPSNYEERRPFLVILSSVGDSWHPHASASSVLLTTDRIRETKKKMDDQVTFRVSAKTGITVQTIPDMTRPGNTTVGWLQSFFQKKLKVPVVHVFIMQGSEGFMPTPDQTLESLRALYGMDDGGKRVISFAVSTQIFQG